MKFGFTTVKLCPTFVRGPAVDPGGSSRPEGNGLLIRLEIGVRPPSRELTSGVDVLKPVL